ncbi:MAG: bacillithiol biosynthesis deacetylase BshB1 [bacterium]
MKLDVIVFSAHPDDAELGMGGSIVKFTKSGFKVGLVDLTQGELGTRGTIQTRKKEAEASSKILGVHLRKNLKFPDGKLKLKDEYVKKVIVEIRKYQPKIIFAPHFNDRHPDHVGMGLIAKEAMFYSGLPKIKSYDRKNLQQPYRPQKLFFFMQTYLFDPAFIVDISKTFETKMKSIREFKTQFHVPGQKNDKEPETFISQPRFIQYVEARARFYGFQIGKEFGEPFLCEEKIDFDFSTYLQGAMK